MAGHSKWANIKHRKERADAKKGKIFSRVTKEIISAVKQGGTDPKTNAKLKLAIQKAKAVNLPNDNIERNIKKAASADQADFVEMSYELYGHGGVGFVVEIMTDNKNRVSSDMKIATNKRGGTIATPGAVLFNFDQKGVLRLPKSSLSEEELFLAVSEAGAEDFETIEDGYIVTTSPQLLYQVKEQLDHLGIAVEEANLEMIPKSYMECSEEQRAANEALVEWLEALDDVDAVYHNMQPL
ncbi:MAG: YebC/PmpR family DNA-binding transcriptional regulator [Chlamydiae bacterium]|nr:YebC/PmpR family DNA-binding transcriptional regulator [Chlamydiota bacterium]